MLMLKHQLVEKGKLAFVKMFFASFLRPQSSERA